MKKWWASGSTWRGAIVLCCCLLLSWQAAAQQVRDIESPSLAVATSDDKSFPIGVAISSLIKLKLLPDHHIDLSTIGTETYPKALELTLGDRAQLAILDGSVVGDSPAGSDDDDRASHGFPASGSRSAGHEIERHQEASLVD